MQRLLVGSLVLVGVLLVAGGARAGVYNLSDSPNWPTFPLPTGENIRLLRSELRDCNDLYWSADVKRQPLSKYSLRAYYLEQAEVLEARAKSHSLLGTTDRIDLSGCLIRLGRLKKARKLLEDYIGGEMAPDDPARFMVYANLAMTYVDEEPGRAVGYQEEALAAWPVTTWPGWIPAQMGWYRRSERYFLELLRSRSREADARRTRWETVDPLFPRVRFVGPSGTYEAGPLAPRMAVELPVEAPQLVLQLVFWLPNDDRLWWQFGELLNAAQDILGAVSIMDDLVVARGLGVQELFEHRKVLKLYLDLAKTISEKKHFYSSLFWALQPRGGLLAPGAGFAANEALAGWPIFLDDWKPPVVKPPSPATPSQFQFWRQMIVAFVGGGLVTILVRLQLRPGRRPTLEEEGPAEERSSAAETRSGEPAKVPIGPGQPEAPI